MPSGGNVEYMEDITSDEGSPERVEGQKQSDRAQAPDSSRSSTANTRNRDDIGRGADQNIPADRNSASRKSVQAPNNAPGNTARENLQSTDVADHSRPKRARVTAPQSDEQTHNQPVDRPQRPPIQPPPKKGFELPNDKLLSSKKDEPTMSSKNRTRRAEASPPRITVEYPNDKLLKNARKRSHDEANRSSDSENDVTQKPRTSRKKSGDDQRKTIGTKKLGIPPRKVLSTQELRERRMQPLNGAYDAIPPVVPVYPLRTGHVGYDMGQPADIRIPLGGHRMLSNRPMVSIKDLRIPGNLPPEDYDDDDDDYLSGLDEYDDAQDSELIPCVVDPRSGSTKTVKYDHTTTHSLTRDCCSSVQLARCLLLPSLSTAVLDLTATHTRVNHSTTTNRAQITCTTNRTLNCNNV
ncbi:hypothetical protein AAVH_30324 [Aphelenchoides avenae]|nr:hypothetical protein AAVH_30324 [Aphelenchus avenae]